MTDRQLCSGDSVTFQDATTGTQPFTYYWDFGDGSTSSQPNPGHVFADTGYFHVELTITDADGCDSTITKTDYIHVQGIPISLISSNKTVTDCYPEQIDFRDSSISNYINQWQWDFGDGSISVLQDPVHNYTQPGTYDVSLIVTSPDGCADTVVKTIEINTLGIQDPTNAYWTITPNPTSGSFKISSESDIQHLSILDVTGREVNFRYVGNVREQHIELDAAQAGTYFILLKTDTGLSTGRLVIR